MRSAKSAQVDRREHVLRMMGKHWTCGRCGLAVEAHAAQPCARRRASWARSHSVWAELLWNVCGVVRSITEEKSLEAILPEGFCSLCAPSHRQERRRQSSATSQVEGPILQNVTKPHQRTHWHPEGRSKVGSSERGACATQQSTIRSPRRSSAIRLWDWECKSWTSCRFKEHGVLLRKAKGRTEASHNSAPPCPRNAGAQKRR